MASSCLLLQTVFRPNLDLSLPTLILHSISVIGELALSTALIKWLLGFGDSDAENYIHGTKTYSLWIIWTTMTVILYVALVTGYNIQLSMIGLIGYFVSFMLVGYCSAVFRSLCFDADFNLAILFIYSYTTLNAMANLYYVPSRERFILLGLGAVGVVFSLGCQAVMAIMTMKRQQSWQWTAFSYRAKAMWATMFVLIAILAVIQLVYVLISTKIVMPRLLAEWQGTVKFIIVQSIVILSLASVAIIMIAFVVLRRWLRHHYYLLWTDVEI